MTEQTPAAVAASYFNALDCGDFPAAMALLHPQVVWHQPGTNRFAGEHVGIESVGALLGMMMEVSEGTFRLTVTGAPMVNGELAAVPVRFTGTRAQASMDMSGVDLLTVRAGKIVEVQLFSEDSPTEDGFWGKG